MKGKRSTTEDKIRILRAANLSGKSRTYGLKYGGSPQKGCGWWPRRRLGQFYDRLADLAAGRGHGRENVEKG